MPLSPPRVGAKRRPTAPPDRSVRYETERATAAQRGYGYKWQRARVQFLHSNPLCVHCERDGRTTPAKVVDHVVPHRGDDQLFWDTDNWQALCKRCHVGARLGSIRPSTTQVTSDSTGQPWIHTYSAA